MGTSRRRVLKQFRPPPWHERADLIVRTLHPRVAAKKLAVTVRLVMARRAELGLPAVAAQFRRGILPLGHTPCTAAEELKIIRTHSPKDAAKLLNLSLDSINHRRRRLGISQKYNRRKPAAQDGRRRRQK
jgi:hypothetical protein